MAALVTFFPAVPAAAGHDPWASHCRYDEATRTVSVHLATSHVVQLHTYEGRINVADLTNYENKGPCGSATTRNTDRIDITEETPGDSRLHLRHTWGRFAPGYTRESDGHSEIEIHTGTLTQLWVTGRDVAERTTIGADGVAFTPDGDADMVGTGLREISVFAEDGDDVISARGGRGTGAWWKAPTGGFLAAYGDDGDDKLYGAGGRDILSGEWGNDLLHGGPGKDDLDGGTGSDLIDGAGGNDYIRGGPWSDQIRAGHGNDYIEADDATADDVDGGDGDDLADIDAADTTVSVESTR